MYIPLHMDSLKLANINLSEKVLSQFFDSLSYDDLDLRKTFCTSLVRILS